MNLEFYNLRRQPFGVTPDPQYLYFGASHQQAFSALLSAVQERRGFSALIAKPGMGKTSLLFKLLELLKGSARTGFLFQTHGDSREVFSSLVQDLEAEPAGEDWPSMQKSLNAALMRESASNRQVVVVIDEAQNLTDDAFESLRLLSNFEKPDAKLLHIILAGQPPLAKKLSSPGLVQLRQRLSVVTELLPLTFEQTGEYIAHRLKVAGHTGQPLFTRDALEFIAQASEGIPRIINHLCFHSLVVGSSAGKPVIDLQTAHMAARALELERGQYGALVAQPHKNKRVAPAPLENFVADTPQWAAPFNEMPESSFNPVYRPRRRGISIFRLGSTAFACSVLFLAIYLVFGEGMSPQQIFNWVQAHVGEKNNALGSERQPESVPAEPPQAAPGTPAQEQPLEQKQAMEQAGNGETEQNAPDDEKSEIVKPASLSSTSATADSGKRVEKKQKKPASKRKAYRNQYSSHPTQSTAFVSRTETIFQFAMEKYGNADWATIRKIRAVNPQLRDPYQVLKRGQMIRLPADPSVRD
jgi:general secretion pathway protein A